jgi:hypothetical protein
MEINLGGDMPTHPRKHSDTTQIVEEILKEAAKPRQSASVRDAFEEKKGAKAGKTKAA